MPELQRLQGGPDRRYNNLMALLYFSSGMFVWILVMPSNKDYFQRRDYKHNPICVQRQQEVPVEDLVQGFLI